MLCDISFHYLEDEQIVNMLKLRGSYDIAIDYLNSNDYRQQKIGAEIVLFAVNATNYAKRHPGWDALMWRQE